MSGVVGLLVGLAVLVLSMISNSPVTLNDIVGMVLASSCIGMAVAIFTEKVSR